MKKCVAVLVALGALLLATACSTPEEVTVSQYFKAMKHGEKGDMDTMSSMAVTPLYVKHTSYEVAQIHTPDVQEYPLPGMLEKQRKLEEQRKEQIRVTQTKNGELEDLEFEVEDARGKAKAEMEQKIEELRTLVNAEKEKVREYTVQLGNIKKEIENEKSLIKLSTGQENNLEMFGGEVSQTRVDLKVTLDDGNVADYVMVLRKYILKLKDGVNPIKGRLIILKFQSLEDFQKGPVVETPEPVVAEDAAPATEGEAAGEQQPPPPEEAEQTAPPTE